MTRGYIRINLYYLYSPQTMWKSSLIELAATPEMSEPHSLQPLRPGRLILPPSYREKEEEAGRAPLGVGATKD